MVPMNDRARRAERKTELRAVLGTMALVAIMVAGSFLLQRRIGLNLADEGFLWYGAQRTLQGTITPR